MELASRPCDRTAKLSIPATVGNRDNRPVTRDPFRFTLTHHVTTIVPCIFGCSEQKYVYVPGLLSVAL